MRESKRVECVVRRAGGIYALQVEGANLGWIRNLKYSFRLSNNLVTFFVMADHSVGARKFEQNPAQHPARIRGRGQSRRVAARRLLSSLEPEHGTGTHLILVT